MVCYRLVTVKSSGILVGFVIDTQKKPPNGRFMFSAGYQA